MTGCRFAGLIAILMSVSASVADELMPELSVKEIMNSIVTPATNTIWGAYQLETESQWQEVGRAALAVIGAANLLMLGGTGEGEAEIAGEADDEAAPPLPASVVTTRGLRAEMARTAWLCESAT